MFAEFDHIEMGRHSYAIDKNLFVLNIRVASHSVNHHGD
jgi:hypothetical protein